jgi:hypothetical protein
MISDDLKQALVHLQLTALEKVAGRQGITPNRVALERIITDSGIAAAYRALHRPPADSRSIPAPQPEERKLSFFRRFAQRWFGGP